ncbi:MAG: fatty acid desaturase [Deltaproteobacteria bacterium]|nr:fatty acid desaturase [Deltaproteobacteria bacterium]
MRLSSINPTLLIFATSLGIFSFNLFTAFYFHPLPLIFLPALFITQVIAVFLMFTPLHDAVHFVASKRRWLNEVILHGAWPVFINHPMLFRKIHLSHHARTNQEGLDPDHFTSAQIFKEKRFGKNIAWLEKWARSFLLIFYYYFYSFKTYGRHEYFWMISSGASKLALIWLSFFGPYHDVFLWVWLAPNLVGIGLLAFANTAWPHHPGKDSARYKNTRIIFIPRLMEVFMLNQNLHLIHHLKPNMPWHQYPRYLEENKTRLIAEGVDFVHFQPLEPLRIQKSKVRMALIDVFKSFN